MTSITADLVAELPRMRWFADKASTIASATCGHTLAIPGSGRIELCIAEVRFREDSPPRRYVVVRDSAGCDAACSEAFARWLLEMVLAGRDATGTGGGRFRGWPVGRNTVPAPAPTEPLAVASVGGDASNTSLVATCGDRSWVIKLFRRCRSGVQPEVAVGRFFALESPWAETPRLCGWLEHDDPLGSAAIATVHEFVPGCATGWEVVTGLLGRSVADRAPALDDALAIAADLGAATGRMHHAFAARPDVAPFAAEPATPSWWRSTAEGMRRRAENVFARVDAGLHRLESRLAERLTAVLDLRQRLLTRFAAVADVSVPHFRIRVHGDYHLGQVLLRPPGSAADPSRRGVFIIDFEGEPARSLEERGEKTSAAKDVAGMLRSFDYAVRHAAKARGDDGDPTCGQRLMQGFLSAYLESSVGQPWWPEDPDAARRVLAAFMLDKAIYELAYEFDNRPDWIDVPLGFLETAVAGADR